MNQNSRLTLFHWLENRIFYGWVIVAAALISVAILVGIRFSFGIFFKSLEAEFGLTRTTLSGVYSAYTLIVAVVGIVGGWALDRYGPRRGVSAMALITGTALLLTSQAASIWQVFLSYSILLSIGTGASLPLLMSVVSRWFYQKRGFALGIATSGTGLGVLVMSPFAAYLISSMGWRMSYVVLALLVWLVVIPAAMLLRRDPGEIGSFPDGISSTTRGASRIGEGKFSPSTGLTLPEAMGTRSFWLMVGIWMFYAFNLNLVLTHLVPHSTDAGISSIRASTVVSVMGVFHISARLAAGRISDSIGRKIPAITGVVIGAMALVWLIWSYNLWTLYLFAVLFGIAWGGIGVTTIVMVSDIFGESHLGKIMGTIEVGFAVGSATGSALGGLVFDATGSYTIAFLIGAVAMLILAFLIYFTRREMVIETQAKQ